MSSHRLIAVSTLLLAPLSTSFQVPHVETITLAHSQRASTPLMKGQGTRGMPGKAVRPPPGSGFNKASKKRMQQRDFKNSEWTLVAEKGQLGESFGSTLAVEAGQSPQGQNFIWTLVRGEAGAGAPGMEDKDASNVYATDGSCRACTFPMTKATAGKEADGTVSLTCTSPFCNTQYSMEKGEVLKWFPGNNPVQKMAAKMNEDKEQMPASILPTRVSQSGRIYVRLPDGTLPITKTAADRAAELAGTAPVSTADKVKAAQQKAKAN